MLAKLDPEYNKTCIRVPAPHVVDKLDLLRLVLIRVTMRTVIAVFQRLQRPILALHPAENVLPVCPVADCCCRDVIFLYAAN